MNTSRKILIAAVISFASSLAWAAPGNNGGGNGGCGVGQQTNGCGSTGGAGGAGGAGGSGIGIGIGQGGAGGGGGNAIATGGTGGNANQGQLQGQLQGQAQGQGQKQTAKANQGQGQTQASRNDNRSTAGSYSEGSAAGASTNTDISIGGDTYERNAPPVIAAEIPNVVTSCRLYLFGGGTNRNGAVSGSIPLGNDQTCLSGAALTMMDIAGGFSQAEKQAVVCKVEGLSELATCKALKNQSKQAATVDNRNYIPADQIIAMSPNTVEHYQISANGVTRIK